MEFLNDGHRCQGGWPLKKVGKIDYVIDTRLFGSAIPLPSPSRSYSLCFPSVTNPPFPASAFSLQPSTRSRLLLPSDWACKAARCLNRQVTSSLLSNSLQDQTAVSLI